VKMLAAYVVLPTFALVYFLGAPVNWRRRVVDLGLAGIVLVAVSLPWILVYDLTPSDRRPFAGSSRENSMLELAVGHNGIGRFVKLASRSSDGRLVGPGATNRSSAVASGPATGWSRLFVRSPAGALRLADGQLAAQVGWLFPLAVMGLLAGALDRRVARDIGPARAALILWWGWLITYAVVYSYAGGIFHFY